VGWACVWHLECDQCGGLSGAWGSGSWEAERAALACGWRAAETESGKRHLCPACLSGGLPGWWPEEGEG
jgi:hypothetical protein